MEEESKLMRTTKAITDRGLRTLSVKELEILRDGYPHIKERITKEIEKRLKR